MLDTSGIEKQAGIAILIFNKIDFTLRLTRGDKEGSFILIKRSVYQENITILNISSSNSHATNFIKILLTELKTKINTKSIIVILVFTSPNVFVTWTKANRETSELINILIQTDLTDLYTIFHPKAKEYTFYSAACRSLTKIDHPVKHKTNISKYKN